MTDATSPGATARVTTLVLTDGVVRLRGFRDADAGEHVAGEDAETVRWLSGGISTLDGTRRWIAGHAAGWRDEGRARCLAVEEVASARLVGMVEARSDIGPDDGVPVGAVNVSYGLYPFARGRGLATRAVELLLAEIASSGVPCAVIRVDPDNVRSLAVPLRLVFSEVASVVTRHEGRLRVFTRAP